ncbi:helix-turn-helix transcriptional regulator [Paenibacillus swuensis]|uniref:helix-turn-helix transcriptional regulator n=1 Tax=Paenibacillus swuensis TaxID=1178515 RepID=UPI0012FBE9EC|nr:AraC family transcriptional regulator [Paenibacillus swuensis]
MYNVVFAEEILSEELREVLFAKFRWYSAFVEPLEHQRICAEFEMIGTEMKTLRLGHSIMVKGALERLLLELARRDDTSASSFEVLVSSHRAAPIRKALVHIQHYFRDEIRLEDAANQARLAPNYFSDCFKETTGVNFQTYVQNLRISFAQSLLLASKIPVTDVC